MRYFGCLLTLAGTAERKIATVLLLALALSCSAVSAQETVSPPAAQPSETAAPTAPAPSSLPTATSPADSASQPAQPAATGAVEPAATPVSVDEAVAPGAEEGGLALPSPDASTLPHDLSPWGMFMAADIIVKGVMIGLAFASLVTWTVWLAKSIELAGAKVRLGAALKVLGRARTLREANAQLGKKSGAAVMLLRSAVDEVEISKGALDHADGDGLKERVASRLSRIQTQAGRRMSRGTGVLATIGSTAPFVGLFGTVWGIMNSFIGISEAQTTNLAVVAPGIAEALLATAIGLVAAIPAVVIYNVFARSVTSYRQSLGDAAAAIERLVSRDLDFRLVPANSDAEPMRQQGRQISHAAE